MKESNGRILREIDVYLAIRICDRREMDSLCCCLGIYFGEKCKESDFEKNSQGRIMYHVVIKKCTALCQL
jgi:hypothetical protein